MTGNIAWIGWCVWVFATLGVTAAVAREWRRTEMHGALVFLAAAFYVCLATIAYLLALL